VTQAEQESDEQLDRMCEQHHEMGMAARDYRAATTDLERQVFAETLLILWHRTKLTRHVALHARSSATLRS
jgi:hypothetical protein